MEEQSPDPERSGHSRGGRADSGAGGRTPTASNQPKPRPADAGAAKVPPPLLFQPPSPSPSAEAEPPAEPTGGRTGDAAPAKKTAAKAPAKKAPAKSAAAKKAPAKKTSAKRTPAPITPDEPATQPAPAQVTPARKKAAPRKAAVPKQPAPEPDQVEPDQVEPDQVEPDQAGPGHAEPPHLVPARVEPPHPVPATAQPPAPQAPPVEAPPAPAHSTIGDPRRLAVRLLDDPAHAPELLAAAAVRLIGPRAADWADAMRSAYPAATDEGLARLATRRFVRLAAAGGLVSAGAGLFAPAAELATGALTRAGLVLHIAAAHGHDPGDPERAAELLVLTQVHSDETAARAALKTATEAHDQRPADHAPPLARAAEAGLRLAMPLAADTGGWALLRMAARVLPGARLLAATAAQVAATERLASRAAAYYRRRSTARAS